jgi:hypothetical protein
VSEFELVRTQVGEGNVMTRCVCRLVCGQWAAGGGLFVCLFAALVGPHTLVGGRFGEVLLSVQQQTSYNSAVVITLINNW